MRGVVAAAVSGVLVLCGIPTASCQAQSATSSPAGDVGWGKKLFNAKAHCDSCHGWAGDGRGDPHAAGNAANLRETALDHDQLVEVIACGRPGTGMPHFDAFAYTDDPCYGMTRSSVGKDLPPDPPRPLQMREIAAVADFLAAKIIGKGKPTKAECIEYFGETARCDDYP